MANEDTTTIHHPCQESSENFIVTINDHNIFSTPSIGAAVSHAWQVISRHNIPANFVDVKRRNASGAYETIWDIDRKEGDL